ncbi:MAG: putative two-component system response regulator [Anaerolineae bacterium]|nr:MAG: putative two-component system response regulator [Anaerolineae bacterium]
MNETQELSEREIEILKLVATGLSNKEIAYQLRISPNTVKVHLKNIFAKINVVSRTEAAMYAVKQGWVEAGFQPLKEENLEEELSQTPYHNPLRLSPLFIGLLGVVGLAFVGLIIFLSLNLADQNAPTVIEVVVTPTAEPARWELVTQMPVARKSMAYAAVDNKIYIIGGETPNGITDRVDIYDTVTGQWSDGARKPTPVSEACGAYVGGKIIVAGGTTPAGEVTNVVEAYDVALDRWEPWVSLPISVTGAACFVYEGNYYLGGGWNGEKVYSEIFSSPSSHEVWENSGKLTLSRAYFGVSELSERIYFVGGWNGTGGLDDISSLSLITDKQSGLEFGSMNESRYRLTSLGVLDKLYILGGLNDLEPLTNSLEINPKNRMVRSIDNPEGKAWHDHGAVSLGEYLYGFGGMLGDRLASEVYRLRVLYTILLPIIQ